jgi:hypothetical protein
MEAEEDITHHLIFYINEFYAIKNITIDLFLLFRKSEAEITKGKEVIEFEIRGKISFLTHWMEDGTSRKADYALSLIYHLNSLIEICQKKQDQALQMLDDLIQTYKTASKTLLSQPIRNNEQVERMEH